MEKVVSNKYLVRRRNFREGKSAGFSLFEKKLLEMVSQINETYGTKYSRMDQVNFFQGCLPQILRGPFLTTYLTQKLKQFEKC